MGNNTSQVRTQPKDSHICTHPRSELELKNNSQTYICDGCKEKGLGARYRCETCDYDLHEACMFPSSKIHHKFFEESTFKFLEKAPKQTCDHCNCKTKSKKYCDVCTKPIKGFSYQSEDGNFDLHPCCMNFKYELNIEGTKFQLKKSKNVSKKLCVLCKKTKVKAKDSHSSFGGLSYVSENKDCQLHVRCVNEWMLEYLEKNEGNDELGKKNKKNNDGDGDGDGDGDDKKNSCLVPRKTDLHVKPMKGKKKRSKSWKIVKIVFEVIVCVLFGDPSSLILNIIESIL